MRQFTQESQGVPPSLRMHRFMVICYWLVPLAVMVAIVVTGILIAIKLEPKSSELEERKNYKPSYQSSLPSLSTMGQAQLLEAYLQAMGGREVLREMRSVRYEGVMRQDDQDRDFQLIISMPDKGSMVFDHGTPESERYVLNGQIAWQVLEGEGKREALLLGEEKTKALIRTCRIHNPLRELALGGKGAIIYIVETTYDGVAALNVTKERIDGSVIECYLDRETLYLMATEDSFFQDGQRRSRKITYSDYRMTSGVVEPFQTTIYIDGEFASKSTLNSVRINPGVMSSIFEVPEELAP